MPSHDPFAAPGPDATAVGTGRLTLDVIVRTGAAPRCQAGGTCGNVLANLAYLGWQAWPLADLGDDDPGDRFCRDLARCGARLDLVRRLPGEETPVIVHHIDQAPGGEAMHRFSSTCPICGHRLRYFEPVPTQGVLDRLPAVPDARAFFFDRDSEGAFLLARHCATKEALIVYEPNYAGREVRFEEALRLAHVFKCSREKLPGVIERLPAEGPSLLIETQGAGGLRFLDRRDGPGAWRHLPAFRVQQVRDAGGSGDWCTAGLIHLLGREGLAGFLAAGEEQVREALVFGQALGAWNCAFEGARGGAGAVSRGRFERDVKAILAGELLDPGAHAGEAAHDLAGAFCRGCGGRS
jgi:sugar/nucleoside kinase (ribokinase family)